MGVKRVAGENFWAFWAIYKGKMDVNCATGDFLGVWAIYQCKMGLKRAAGDFFEMLEQFTRVNGCKARRRRNFLELFFNKNKGHIDKK